MTQTHDAMCNTAPSRALSKGFAPRRARSLCLLLCVLAVALAPAALAAREVKGDRAQVSESDYAARRLLQRANDLLLAGENERGVKMLQTVTEQHADSPVRFEAYLALGKHMIDTANYPQAVIYLARLREMEDPQQPLVGEPLDLYLEALYLTGVAHFQAKQYVAAFPILRKITSEYPNTRWANQAFYYIGMCHFQQGHWNKAIEALGLVGTFISPDQAGVSFVEAGRRFYIKIEDGDLPVLRQLGRDITVSLETGSGDRETLTAIPLSGNGQTYIASIPTAIADPTPDDRTLQVRGGDTITVTYLDDNTLEGQKDLPRTVEVRVVSTAALSFTLASFDAPATAAFTDQPLNLLLQDADLDTSPAADTARVRIVSRYKESLDGLDDTAGQSAPTEPITEQSLAETFGVGREEQTERWRIRDEVVLTLQEVREPAAQASAEGDSAGGGPIHTGRFTGSVRVTAHREGQAIDRNDQTLVAATGDQVLATFVDELHIGGDSPRDATATLTVVGKLDTSVVARQNIVTDAVLRSRKNLVEATAFLELARIFKSMGLSAGAAEKAEQGLDRVNPVIVEESPIPSELREEALRLKWELYIAQGRYDQAIATCRTFNELFPDSPFVDQALMGIANIRFEEASYRDAIDIYRQVLALENSQAKAEAQFKIAEALEAQARVAASLRKDAPEFSIKDAEAAVQAYKLCAERHPDSPFAGPSLGKLIDFHLATRDFVAADDLLNQVFTDHPDAEFLDVMLLKWVLVAYRMGDYDKSLDKCNQLIFAYPGSTHAEQAKELLPRIEKVAARARGEG